MVNDDEDDDDRSLPIKKLQFQLYLCTPGEKSKIKNKRNERNKAMKKRKETTAVGGI
jgi:hypothetical protein